MRAAKKCLSNTAKGGPVQTAAVSFNIDYNVDGDDDDDDGDDSDDDNGYDDENVDHLKILFCRLPTPTREAIGVSLVPCQLGNCLIINIYDDYDDDDHEDD